MIGLHYTTGITGVPILTNTAIEADAERLLRDYDPSLLKTPQPLNVEDFAENYLGLRIHYDNLSHDSSVLGRMVFSNSRIPVYVPSLGRAEYCSVEAGTVIIDNSLEEEGRAALFRSTMMHECGHKVYHAQYYREEAKPPMGITAARERIPATACRQADIEGSRRDGRRRLVSDRDWLEHQAKYFSAAALMPASMVRRVYDELEIGENLRASNSRASEQDLLFWLTAIFRVSAISAEIRIRQLKLDFESHQTADSSLLGMKNESRPENACMLS